ncbi:MAG: cytochrome b [Steroidobacteraceae bacterium]
MNFPKIKMKSEYCATAKTLHWLVFILLLAQYAVAIVMPEVHRDTKPVGLVELHLSLGATILIIVMVRLIWRIARPVSLASVETSIWTHRTAMLTHWALYGLMILVPILGWVNTCGRGWPVHFLGLIALPAIAPVGFKNLGLVGDIHGWIAYYILTFFIALHLGGVLYHQFVLRDNVLLRMLPSRRLKEPQ